MSEDWRKAARLQDLKDGVPYRVVIDSVEVALHRIGGEVYATANICTHADARLSDGYIEDHNVICPMHEGGFDVRTGAAVFAPCSDALQTYRVKIAGDEVSILWDSSKS